MRQLRILVHGSVGDMMRSGEISIVENVIAVALTRSDRHTRLYTLAISLNSVEC